MHARSHERQESGPILQQEQKLLSERLWWETDEAKGRRIDRSSELLGK